MRNDILVIIFIDILTVYPLLPTFAVVLSNNDVMRSVVGWAKDTKCEWKSIWIQTFAGISPILVLHKSTKYFLVNSYKMQDLYTEWINS